MTTYYRTLEFDVDKQRLTKRKDCDFSGLVAGSVGYLQAKFYLSSEEWHRCTVKVARFWLEDLEYSMKLDENNCCLVPPEVLIGKTFKVSILGAANKYRIQTNRATVKQGVN